MMEWGAMGLVTLQLVLVSGRQLYWSWVICLLACCLWAGVAVDREMWGLLGQQGVIAAVAVFGFLKEHKRLALGGTLRLASAGTLPEGLEGGKNYYITKSGHAVPHDDHRSGRQPDDDYGGNGGC